MRYGFFIFSMGFLLFFNILPVPHGNFSFQSEAGGQSDGTGEAPEDKEYISEDGMVHLQSGMGILELIKAVSEINEETYIIDSSVKHRNVRIITPEGGMRKEDVLMFFDTVLRLNGLAVVKSDGINKVVNSGDISGHGTPVETDNKD